jgi:hypothetical protein
MMFSPFVVSYVRIVRTRFDNICVRLARVMGYQCPRLCTMPVVRRRATRHRLTLGSRAGRAGLGALSDRSRLTEAGTLPVAVVPVTPVMSAKVSCAATFRLAPPSGRQALPPRPGHKPGRAARSLARENPGASSLRYAAAHRQHHFRTIRRSAARARCGRQADAVGPAGAGGSARPARRDTVVQGRGCGNSRPRQSPRERDRRS